MKLSTVVMGVGIGAFALVGCGGSSSPGEDSMKEPTAKIKKDQVSDVLDRLAYASDIFDTILGSDQEKRAKMLDVESEATSYVTLPDEGTEDCSTYLPEKNGEIIAGTSTVKYTIGSSKDKYKKSGKVAYTEDKKECIDYYGYKRTEKRNVTKTWDVDTEEYGKWEGTTELISDTSERIKDDKNKYTVSEYSYEWSYESTSEKESYSNKDAYSSKGLWDGEDFEKYGIVTTYAWEESDTSETESGTLSGSFYFERYEGWFTVVTDNEFVSDGEACLQGKATVKGEDATIVIECKNKEVVVTYNGDKVDF